MEKPPTGFDECLRILLSCFRARNSGSALLYIVCIAENECPLSLFAFLIVAKRDPLGSKLIELLSGRTTYNCANDLMCPIMIMSYLGLGIRHR